MSKNKNDLFTKRLATLLLAQANKEYLKSRASGFKTSGEIIASEKYFKRCMKWCEDLEPCPCEICSSQDEREVL